MKRILIYLPALVLLFPAVTSAQSTIQGLIGEVDSLIASLIPLVFGIALLGFLWGLARYILRAGDEKAQEEGRRIMLWGIIILFVMSSIWGIVAILQTAFGTTGVTNPPAMPTLSETPVYSPDGEGGADPRGPN